MQGETVVPFTDLPATLNFNPSPVTRQLDVRTIADPVVVIHRIVIDSPEGLRLVGEGVANQPGGGSADSHRSTNKSSGIVLDAVHLLVS